MISPIWDGSQRVTTSHKCSKNHLLSYELSHWDGSQRVTTMHACEQKHRLLYDPFTPASSHKKAQDRHRPVESGPVGTGRVGQLGPGRSGSSEQCLSNSGSFFLRFRPLGRVTTSQNESHMRRQASVFARPAASRIRNSLYFSKGAARICAVLLRKYQS